MAQEFEQLQVIGNIGSSILVTTETQPGPVQIEILAEQWGVSVDVARERLRGEIDARSRERAARHAGAHAQLDRKLERLVASGGDDPEAPPGHHQHRIWRIYGRDDHATMRVSAPCLGAGRFPPQMRYVYDFDEEAGGGRELLGGKGIGLAEMTQLGIPVPDGFTITTDACRAYLAAGGEVPEGLDSEVDEHVAALEERTGKGFGDDRDPLLVSVRSGAAISMPGMMDTILNLGLNDVAVEGLATSTGNERFALDSYRRLVQMYGEVVEGIDAPPVRAGSHGLEGDEGRRAGRRPHRRRSARARRDLLGDLRGGDGQPLPAGAARAAPPRVPRRLRLVERAARAGLPARQRDPGRSRDGRERRADGVRQPRRELGHRGLLHPRPGDGRAEAVRGVPRERPGRGRRRRHPHARADRGDEGADARRVRPARRHARPAREPLPRPPGHRVHGRGGDALPPADPHGQAHRGCGAARRGGDGRRGPDLARGGGRAHRPGPARPAPASDDRPERARRRRGARAERVAGSGIGRDRPRRGHGRGAREGRRVRDPRPLGDDPGRHPRAHPRGRACSPRTAA